MKLIELPPRLDDALVHAVLSNYAENLHGQAFELRDLVSSASNRDINRVKGAHHRKLGSLAGQVKTLQETISPYQGTELYAHAETHLHLATQELGYTRDRLRHKPDFAEEASQ